MPTTKKKSDKSKKKAGSADQASTSTTLLHPVVDVSIVDDATDSFRAYGRMTIGDRAIPHAADGLLPVQRRTLVGAKLVTKANSDGPTVKCARIVGDTMSRLHPHGDSSLYAVLTRLSRDWSLTLPLFEFRGNLGSMDANPAASRYTEAKLNAVGDAMLVNLNEHVVPTSPTYDNSMEEPVVLPAGFPNALINRVGGIAVSMTSTTLPNNLIEVTEAIKAFVENPKITLDELMEIIPGPDFPTPCVIFDADAIRSIYETGTGRIMMRAKHEVEILPNGGATIMFTGLPYQSRPASIEAKIKELIEDRTRLPLLSTYQVVQALDTSVPTYESRILLSLKNARDVEPVLNFLWSRAGVGLQTSYVVQNRFLVDGSPKLCSLIDLISIWVSHRRSVITKRTKHRLAKAERRLHIVDGLIKAHSVIDKLIAMIRSCHSRKEAIEGMVNGHKLLGKGVKFSPEQAEAIGAIRLDSLTNLDIKALKDEKVALEAEIKRYNQILKSRKELEGVIVEELEEVTAKLGNPRRCELDFVTDITVLKAKPASRTQAVTLDPGGRTEYMLSNKGMVTCSEFVTAEDEDVDLPEGRGNMARGNAAVLSTTGRTNLPVNAITSDGYAWRLEPSVFNQSEEPVMVAATIDGGNPVGLWVDALEDDDERPYILMITALGQAKLMDSTCLTGRQSFGYVSRPVEVFKLDEDDYVVNVSEAYFYGVEEDDTSDLVALYTSYGNVLVFPVNQLNPKSHSAKGNPVINLEEGEVVNDAVVIPIIESWEETAERNLVFTTVEGKMRTLNVEDIGIKKRGQKPIAVFPKKVEVEGWSVGIVPKSPDLKTFFVTSGGAVKSAPKGALIPVERSGKEVFDGPESVTVATLPADSMS